MVKLDKIDYDRISNLPDNSIVWIIKYEGEERALGLSIKDYKEDREKLKCIFRSAETTLNMMIQYLRKD